jgi:hypothetical protein
MTITQARLRERGCSKKKSSPIANISQIELDTTTFKIITCNRCLHPHYVPYSQLHLRDQDCLRGLLHLFICPECEMLSITYTNEYHAPRLYLFYLPPE